MNRETGSFDRSIGFNLFLLKLVGVISRDERSFERRALACFAFFSMTVYSVSYLYEFLRRDGRNLESFSLILSFVGAQARYAMLLMHRDSCQTMLNDCELLWSRLNPREKRVVGDYARKSNRLAASYFVNCQLTIFSYMAVALFTSWMSDESSQVARDSVNVSDVSGVVHGENGRSLPYAFFLEIRGSPWYEIACVLQFFTVTSIGLTSVGVDTTAPLFALIACGHLDVIRSRIESLGSSESKLLDSESKIQNLGTTELKIENLGSSESKFKRLGYSELKIVKLGSELKIENFGSSESKIENIGSVKSSTVPEGDLRNSLIHHRMLLEFCKRIEHCMNVILLTQMMISTYNVSLVGFKLVGDDPNKFKYVTQLLISLIQLLLCNWPADLLLAKSQAIATAAYNSPWYRWSANSRTPIAMLLVRAQKPCCLTAGKFVVLSLETFGSMISTSVSFFAVVSSMN